MSEYPRCSPGTAGEQAYPRHRPETTSCIPGPQQASWGQASPHVKALRHERVSQGLTTPQDGPGAPPDTAKGPGYPLHRHGLPAHSRTWGDHQGAVPPRQRPPWGKIPAWRVAHGLTHKAINFFGAGAPLAEGPHASAPAHVCAQASRWFALKSPLQNYTFFPAL